MGFIVKNSKNASLKNSCIPSGFISAILLSVAMVSQVTLFDLSIKKSQKL
jgi:hypothetical protein